MSRYRIDHVHLRSPDPDRAAAFYTDMLGARQTGRQDTPAGLRVMLDLGGLAVFIERVPADTHRPPEPPFLGLEHIGLAVDDLDAVAAELRDRGVRFTMEPTSPRPGLKICFIEAPDGVRVELLQRAPA